MSLVVWLPLNGTLENKGISNAKVTNNGATIDTDGKIGYCYSFAGTTSSYMTASNVSIPATTWSAAAWVYPTVSSASAYQWIFGINGSTAGNFKFGICTYKDKLGVRTSNSTYTVSDTHSLNKWYHICVTYNNKLLKIYIDGILKYTNTSVTASSSTNNFYIGIRGGMAGAFHGKINDIRVYNNCISPAEVKEIAQGLVLHYKLDDMSTTIVEDSSGYNNNGVRTGTISAYTDSPRYTQCMNLSAAASRINCGRSGMMTDSITINFWANLPTIPSALSETTGFVSCAENGGFRIQVGNNAHLRSIIYINSAYAVIEGETALQPNTWYMITLIYDRLNSKLYEYLNGEKEAEVTIENTGTIGYNSSNVIWIGAEARSNTNYYNALIEKVSDFRIYCTPLLDTDIKSLYNNSMKVDNLQNIHTFKLVENKNKIAITRTGQLYCNELNETTTAKFHKNLIIEAAEIIER